MAVFNVSTSTELYDALANAVGGDTIELAGGDYGDLTLNHQTSFDFTYDSPITIVSADSANPAALSSMSMAGASNITFDGIQFDYTFEADDALWEKPFSISDSSNITIKNSMFDGDVASGTNSPSDGYGTGFGLSVWASSNVTVDNTEFKSWWKAASFNKVTDLAVTDNEIHDIRADGLNFSEVQTGLIEGNYIHDFRVSKESGDHADMIQVISTTHSEVVTSDLTIRGNILDIGEGDITQMIYMANGKYNATQDDAWFYQNITVEDNVLRGSQIHGVSVGHANGVVIRNNTMIDAEHPDGVAAPVIRTNQSTNVLIENNAVPGIVEDETQSTWTVQGNVILQNEAPELAGYFEDQFITSSTGESVGGFILDPNGELAASGVGATWLAINSSPGALTPAFDVQSEGSDSQTLVFDASYTYGPTGAVLAEDAQYTWYFGDGTTATGQVVSHSFEAAGVYDVTLQVTLPNGTSVSAESSVRAIGSNVLSFNPNDGAFYLQSYGVDTMLEGANIASVADGNGGMTVDLSASENLAEIPAQNLNSLLGSSSFDVSMSFQADQPGVSQGWILHLHSTLSAIINASGDIQVDIWDDQGEKFTLKSTGLILNDGGIHSFEINLDDETDVLQLVVDGAIVDDATFNGALSQGIGHSLKFGSPWGGSFDGQMHSFDLDVLASDYSVYSGVSPGSKDSIETQPDPLPQPGPVPEPEAEPTPVEDPDLGPEPAPTEDPTDTVPPTAEEDPAPLPDPSPEPTSLPDLDDFILNIEALNESSLRGDAAVVDTATGPAVSLDGSRDFVDLGNRSQFEDAEQLSFAVDFTNMDPEAGNQRLVWNQGEIGLATNGDGLKLHVAQNFHKGIKIENLGLNDGAEHTAMVMADSVSDRLQVIFDDEVVYDQVVNNFDNFGASDWTLGSAKRHDFDGLISDFRIEEGAEFVEEALVPDDGSLIA